MVRGACPRCHAVVQLGVGAGEPVVNARALVSCGRCGAQNDERSAGCVACGAPLHGVAAPQEDSDDVFRKLIPYKNVPALVGYYLAVFALIPFLGIVLGLSAFVLGIIGLCRVRANPEARGKAHALVAIILGGICGFGYLILLILLITAAHR